MDNNNSSEYEDRIIGMGLALHVWFLPTLHHKFVIKTS